MIFCFLICLVYNNCNLECQKVVAVLKVIEMAQYKVCLLNVPGHFTFSFVDCFIMLEISVKSLKPLGWYNFD